jgi:pimeloyl-ACP methyl ester carboxylesterase
MTAFDAFARGRYVIEPGLDIIYRDSGGDGPIALLIHGWPQHSLMWHTIAPTLAEAGYRVIAPDLRGAGASSITLGGFDKVTMSGDLHALMTSLAGNVPAFVFGYDLGAGVAAAYARMFGASVRRLAVAEFGLPGYGYEHAMTPSADWTLSSNWHLSLFSVPDAAVWLLAGRERELLAWFFWHLSYAGGQVSADHFEEYARAISRPGALRAGISYYAAVWQDAKDNASFKDHPLAMPTLAFGGEASSGPVIEMIWSPICSDLRTAVIPKAGHWIGDENPQAVAELLISFFQEPS